jgi:hypothetical protein
MINGLADHVRTARTPHGTGITLSFEHAVLHKVDLAESVKT